MSSSEYKLRESIYDAINSMGLAMNDREIVVEKKSEPFTNVQHLGDKAVITISAINEVDLVAAGSGQTKKKVISIPVFITTKSDSKEDRDIGDIVDSIMSYEWETLSYSDAGVTDNFSFNRAKKVIDPTYAGVFCSMIMFEFENCGQVKIEYSFSVDDNDAPIWTEVSRVKKYKIPSIQRDALGDMDMGDDYDSAQLGKYIESTGNMLSATVLSPDFQPVIAQLIEEKTLCLFKVTIGNAVKTFGGYFQKIEDIGMSEVEISALPTTKIEVSNG